MDAMMLEERLVRECQPLLRKVIMSRVRNRDWWPEAESLADERVLKWVRKTGECPSDALLGTIAVNVCRDVCSGHRKDPVQIGEDSHLGEAGELEMSMVMVDLRMWVETQTYLYQRILTYVLSLSPYEDYADLARKTGTSKATVSRALASLADYLVSA